MIEGGGSVAHLECAIRTEYGTCTRWSTWSMVVVRNKRGFVYSVHRSSETGTRSGLCGALHPLWIAFHRKAAFASIKDVPFSPSIDLIMATASRLWLYDNRTCVTRGKSWRPSVVWAEVICKPPRPWGLIVSQCPIMAFFDFMFSLFEKVDGLIWSFELAFIFSWYEAARTV